METWHNLEMKSTATMMFGIDESYEERIEHLLQIRELKRRPAASLRSSTGPSSRTTRLT